MGAATAKLKPFLGYEFTPSITEAEVIKVTSDHDADSDVSADENPEVSIRIKPLSSLLGSHTHSDLENQRKGDALRSFLSDLFQIFWLLIVTTCIIFATSRSNIKLALPPLALYATFYAVKVLVDYAQNHIRIFWLRIPFYIASGILILELLLVLLPRFRAYIVH